VRWVIRGYSLEDDSLQEEIFIDDILEDIFRNLFGFDENESMAECYVLDGEAGVKVAEFLRMNRDFSTGGYFLESNS
jgi:hypothetical protein